MNATSLPPGCEFRNGRLVRLLTVHAPDGSSWVQERPVALSLAEAKEQLWDFFSPTLGWIRDGRKTEKEHPLGVEVLDLSDLFEASQQE